MKIALFHNLPSGGAKRAIYNWVQGLAGSHTIDVYTLSTADHDFCDIRPFVENYYIFKFYPRKMFRSPLGRLNQLQRWRDLIDLESLNHKIAKKINKGGYDLLFANPCLYSGVPAVLQYIEIPSVYYLHEPFDRKLKNNNTRTYTSNGRWRSYIDRVDPLIWLYRHKIAITQFRGIVKATQLLANSQFTLEHIRDDFGVEPLLSPYGVNLTNFHRIKNIAREDFVISVGEMTPRKGFDFIIECLGRIPIDQRPPLILACNNVNIRELKYIQDLADHSGVNLQVLTRLDTNELRDLYNRALLCIYTPVHEPFGLVPLEAMACGTPVVAVNEGGVRESVIDGVTGRLVNRDTAEFASAVTLFLKNPELVEQYGLNAEEYVTKNWTWSGSVANLEKYLFEAMAVGIENSDRLN